MKLTNDQYKSTRLVVTVLCVLLSLHFAFYLGKRYSVEYYSEYRNDNVNVSGINEPQYKELIKAVPKDYRADAVASTKVTYFGFLPYWGIYIVYAGYALMAMPVILGLFVGIREIGRMR